MMKRFRFPRLWRNKKGVAAVEFALILPMFAGIYLGSVELTELLLVNARWMRARLGAYGGKLLAVIVAAAAENPRIAVVVREGWL